MKNRLFIIGNGFDLAHKLHTRFNPDFKSIAEAKEQGDFWDLYQTSGIDIWSDFENLLGHPDFNSLEEIFNGYEPDYLSDRESDRDGIICQVELNGRLKEALYEFAERAETELCNISRVGFMEEILDKDGFYVNFNYTHTLEIVYDIPAEKIIHIHGEVGSNNLELGYPEGNFSPEKYVYDVRQKGKEPYAYLNIEEYINQIEDVFVRQAYSDLVNKCKSFSKRNKRDLLSDFLANKQIEADEILVYGHSCNIDFSYFKMLNERYPRAYWAFYVKGDKQEDSAKSLINRYGIQRARIVKV